MRRTLKLPATRKQFVQYARWLTRRHRLTFFVQVLLIGLAYFVVLALLSALMGMYISFQIIFWALIHWTYQVNPVTGAALAILWFMVTDPITKILSAVNHVLEKVNDGSHN